VNTAKTDTIEAVMVRGELPLRKPAVKGLDDWRMAIAHAIVEQTKKTATPVLLDAAKVQAAAVTRAQLAAAKGDPTVVKHWRRLTGAPTASVLEMLAAPPAAAEPDAVMQAAE
jgi:hypothetical protein